MQVWSVSGLVQAIADSLAARFRVVTVRGEISGLVRAASGHHYFNLKDGGAQLRCVLFRRQAVLHAMDLRDGLAVRIRATPSIYEPRGDLQLIVESIEHDGEGALLEAFMRLKGKLQAEGLFDAERKRPLPGWVRTVGVVTSPQAAALRDVLATLRRRSPQVRVVLYPASVQGAQAPGELLAALRRAEARAEVDLLLLVRGGGSLEDLWAFNDEALVRAVAGCSLPVVSGVGHETDFTLCDFAADLRAPTPTAAAELGVPSRQTLEDALRHAALDLRHTAQRRLRREQQRLDQLALRWPQPASLVSAPLRRLGELQWRLRRALADQPGLRARELERRAATLHAAPRRMLQTQTAKLGDLAGRLHRAANAQLDTDRLRIDRAALRLQLLDPGATLKRGYLLGLDADGRALRDVRTLAAGQTLLLADADHAATLTVHEATPAAHPLNGVDSAGRDVSRGTS